jgi:peptide/nickel transport system substrate-binding protein
MKNSLGHMRQSSFFSRLPKKSEMNSAFSLFSRKEWVIFSALAVFLIFGTLGLLSTLNQSFMTTVPLRGGDISEGIVGTPRFVNPALAFSATDQDLVGLIYSGLMRKGEDGTLIPDLADKYEISKDGLTYTFTLKDNLYFHDGKPLTASDVIFTINTIKDALNKSPRKVNWEGVSVEEVDSKTIVFNLRQPYASFLANTTLGIMPAHIWEGSPLELNDANTSPVGSGPYEISGVNKESSGIIDSYELTRFDRFSLGQPYLKNIDLHFYGGENEMITALQNGTIMQISSISPQNAKALEGKGYRVDSAVLPRVFGLFFNQNQNQIFLDKNVVKAIDQAVDKDRIVREVLFGYGESIDDPIPPNMASYAKLSTMSANHEENITKAKEILAKDGWKTGEDGFLERTKTDKGKKSTESLAFSISTGNAPELAKSAEMIKNDLTELGIQVDVKTFDVGNLNQSVIRPRKYDALLFGQIINNESDLFAFWHSSQRKDPGLNVAMYTNAKVDKILEDAFVTLDNDARTKKYIQFEDEVRKDQPAVFLYSPNFIYVVDKNLQGLSIKNIITPSDRFASAYLWYTEEDNVWKIFAKN